MSDAAGSNAPYQILGSQLRKLREQTKQSLSDVSGAVEIDEGTLERIERGQERPAEDILLLLINFFGMPDQEAIQLWELAGYDGELPEQLQIEEPLSNQNAKNVLMVVAMDMRTIYSDGLEVEPTKSGMTLYFTQSDPQHHRLPVARIGISHEQAKEVITTLQQALLKATYTVGPKPLPPSISTE